MAPQGNRMPMLPFVQQCGPPRPTKQVLKCFCKEDHVSTIFGPAGGYPYIRMDHSGTKHGIGSYNDLNFCADSNRDPDRI